jgi:hypothetical protein
MKRTSTLYITIAWSVINNSKSLIGTIEEAESTSKARAKKYLYEYLKKRYGNEKNITIKWENDRYVVTTIVEYKYAQNDIMKDYYKITPIPLELEFKKLKKKFT